jgi:RHS repeat-associated protein
LTPTWARNTTPLVTTSGYTSGLQKFTNYNDATPAVTRAYDALGRVSTITQFHQSKIAYTYDPADLALGTETVSSDLDHNGTDEFTRTLDRSHDTLGRNTGYDLKNGAAVEFSAIATYHPLSGRPFTVANGTQSFTYGYQPSSHLITTVTGPVHVATSNWEANRDVLASKINALAIGGTVRSSIYYTVNSLGQRTDATRGGPAPGTTHWDYDGLGQVVLANDSNNAADRVFEYDTIGNRKKSAVGTILPGTDNYATNAVNQYTAIPSAPAAPLYDDDGNVTSYPLTPPGGSTQSASLVWDAENRLIATTPVGGSTTSYQYDALGRRIAKITAGTPTVFLYDGWNLIAEYTGASLTLRASFLWGTDLSGTAQGAGGVGGLLAAQLHTGPNMGVYYPTYDGNGNVSEYLNSTGGVAAHYEYGPFGEPLVSTGTVATQMPFRFSTKYQDAETRLLYYGYRYYDPITGRWPSRDPIGEDGGINLNVMALNDPVGSIDPLGQMGRSIIDIFTDFKYDDIGISILAYWLRRGR